MIEISGFSFYCLSQGEGFLKIYDTLPTKCKILGADPLPLFWKSQNYVLIDILKFL